MARRKQPVIPDQLLDQLLAGTDAKMAFEKDGLLDELKKALAERVLNAEMDHHLDAGAADGRANSRNGYGKKQVLTETGKIALEVPRDRLSTFDPQLIAKYQRRFPGFDEKIICIGLDLVGQVSDLGVGLRASDRCDQQATATGWLCWSINFSLAIGRLSRKVCMGVLP
jgi:hypothetical protein